MTDGGDNVKCDVYEAPSGDPRHLLWFQLPQDSHVSDHFSGVKTSPAWTRWLEWPTSTVCTLFNGSRMPQTVSEPTQDLHAMK